MNTSRTWVILGATSIIAKEFAHHAARLNHSLLLVARCKNQLDILAADIRLRYHIHCDIMVVDFSKDIQVFITALKNQKIEMDLFIAYSAMINNVDLTQQNINQLLTTNVTSTSTIIHAYWNKPQQQHTILFLSSVAACRGRAKNSLYGASKAAIEVYLQGLQQIASTTQQITIARLGYIDTHVTFGEPGIFYASTPKACADACWKAMLSKKRRFYHPFFWRYIMGIITKVPNFLYEKIRF